MNDNIKMLPNGDFEVERQETQMLETIASLFKKHGAENPLRSIDMLHNDLNRMEARKPIDEQELRQKQIEEFMRRCREQEIDVDVTAGR